MSDDTALKDRLRRANDAPAPPADLPSVARRARRLRARRSLAVALSVCVIGAAVAIPLAGLRHLGEGTHAALDGTPVVTFAPAPGWHTVEQAPPDSAPYAWTTNVTPPPDDGSIGGLPNNLLEALPADGIAIGASQWIETRNPLPDTGSFRPSTLPLRLSDARNVGHGGQEGLPRTDITDYYFDGTINGRAMIVQVWIGAHHPSAGTLRVAQAALGRLTVARAPATTPALDDFGMRMELPAGWRGFLFRQGDPMLVATDGAAGNLWGEGGVRRTLHPGESAILMVESSGLGDLAGWEPSTLPVTIGPDQVCEGCEAFDDGGPPASGHALYQRTFTYGNRAFDLYVEFGAPPSDAEMAKVNDILATLELQAHPYTYPTAVPGTGTVGEIPEGDGTPTVSADATHRHMWDGFALAGIDVPEGWTGWVAPVLDMQQPSEVFVLGTWAFPRGGYCAPITALQRMPSDGALVTIDGYVTGYGYPLPNPSGFTPWPQRFHLDQSVAASAVPCTGGVAVRTYLWSMHGKLFRARIALGSGATDNTTASIARAIDSFATNSSNWG